MKKESNVGLFFLLAVGIVGLGLYFGAAEDYSRGELQLYHIVCWVVLITALLRVLELVWEPVRALWDLAWGKTETISEKKPQSFDPHEDEYGRKKPFQNEKAFSYEKDFSEDGEISRADGVIIMPDPGSRLYLDDGSSCRDRQKKGASEDFPVQRVSSVPAAVPEDLPSGENGTQKKKEKKKSKKKDGKKKKK